MQEFSMADYTEYLYFITFTPGPRVFIVLAVVILLSQPILSKLIELYADSFAWYMHQQITCIQQRFIRGGFTLDEKNVSQQMSGYNPHPTQCHGARTPIFNILTDSFVKFELLSTTLGDFKRLTFGPIQSVSLRFTLPGVAY